VIPISDKEHNHDKEVEDRLRSEITEEFKKKKWGSRRKAGLILSGIGGILYLLLSSITFLMSSWFGDFFISPLIAGAISLIGTIIAIKKAKIGGTVILLSIPISMVSALFLQHIYLNLILNLLIPIPFPHSVFVIIGGFLCLVSPDKESSEYENKEYHHEKEVEERLRSEITEEFKKKKLRMRKKVALILSGIGGIIYLLQGIISFGVSFFTSGNDLLLLGISYLIVGAISLLGIIKGVKKIKLGGMVILISILISIVITLSTFYFYSISSTYLYWSIIFIILPSPFPSSVFVIIGGIVCLLSSDKESSERENSMKIAV